MSLELMVSDLQATKEMVERNKSNNKRAMLDMIVKGKERNIKWLEVFKKFAETQKIPFDFVIIKANQFNSGFSKEAFGNILISFDSIEAPQKFKDVTNILKADKSSRDKFFYLYCRKNKDSRKIDLNVIASLIGRTAMDELYS